MIAFLRGDFIFKTPALVHIDVHGVGYEVQISLHTYSQIQHLEKEFCILITRLRKMTSSLWLF